MRKILEIKGEEVTYVLRGKLAFPSWDQKLWRSTSREAFAREVKAEVPCGWRAEYLAGRRARTAWGLWSGDRCRG